MSNFVPKINDFDISKIGLGEPKDMSTYGKLIPFTYDGKPYVPYINMPSMVVSSVKEQDGKYTLVLNFSGKDDQNNPARARALSSALDKIKALDEHIFKIICESAKNQGYKSGLLTSPKEKFDERRFREDRYRSFCFQPENDQGEVFPEIIRLKLFNDKENPDKFSSMREKSLIADAQQKPLAINKENIVTEITRNSKLKPFIRPMSLFVSKTSGKISVSVGFFHGILLERSKVSEAKFELDDYETELASTNAGLSGMNLGTLGTDDDEEDEEEEVSEEEDDEDVQLARGL